MAISYPTWVAPQPMDVMGGFQGGFNFGASIGQEQSARKAGDALTGFLYGQNPQTAQQPTMSLSALGYNAPTQPQPAQPSATPNVVGGSHDAVAGATVPGLGAGLDAYLANTRQAESGENDAARNPLSSATGRYQFTTGTWQDMMRNHPELGLTADGRLDPAQQERAMRQFTANNAGVLQSKGIPVNPGTLYAAHFLGAGGATGVLSLPDQTPMVAAVSPEVINANPFLRDMTVGDFKQWSARKGGGSNGGYQAPTANASAFAGQGGGAAGGFMPVTGLPTAAGPQSPTAGLPPRDVMEALFRSPDTRPIAIQMAQAAMNGQVIDQFQTFVRADGSLWQMNTQTGEMTRLQEGASQDPFTLGTGEVRYDAQGNVIASGPESSPADAPVGVREYEWYANQEREAGRQPLSYLEFQQAMDGGGFSVQTSPDGSVSVTQGNGRPLTEQQSKDAVYATRAAGTLPIINQFGNELTNPVARGVEGDPTGLARGALQSPEFQQAQQAGLEFLQAILRKDTGAAITTQEQNEYGRVYLPQPGDTPEVLAQKQQSRERALNALMAGMAPQAILNMERALSGDMVAPQTPVPQPSNSGLVQTEITPQRYHDNPTRYQAQTPPDDWTGDRNLWPYMTPETRALWQ
ncbi:hypothetical protein NO932_06625 [Pelagibacterium sp. 26DY04]|uniref:hypothetical protein n=1 Tax=Pelagibacterium sp. 26DY04 TaxID=2967130 RepID=UPI00281625E8|nr:hypothetical protein [Pelagibacterium sp. 26DY04]WMT88280.1 hypothetical protein NO932_06625 [Pelagibacterium sp. 26DY04]